MLNGDFGIIQEVNTQSETRNITLKRKISEKVIEKKVPLHFRDVTIQFKDPDEKTYNIECKIIENILYSKNSNLSVDEIKALYIDFKIRYPRLKPGTSIFKEALKRDEYFNALCIKFGYALTCHKAQGGEWKRAFVDCKTTMGYFNAAYFRWLYTALTRAKEVLYTVNEPHFKIASSLKPPKIENIKPSNDVIVLKPEVLETELSFGFSDEQENLKVIFYAIFDLIKD